MGSAKSRPEITTISDFGRQIEKRWLVWEGSAGEEVCQGGEKGGVKLPEIEDFAGEHSVKDLARRSEGGGGSMCYRFFHRPPISFLLVTYANEHMGI